MQLGGKVGGGGTVRAAGRGVNSGITIRHARRGRWKGEVQYVMLGRGVGGEGRYNTCFWEGFFVCWLVA